MKLSGGLATGGLAAAAASGGLSVSSSAAVEPEIRTVAERGSGGLKSLTYYLTFCRIPTAGLATWKSIMDTFAQDGAENVVLWMGGAFRSRKFPITWKYNASHRNVRSDFVRTLIDYAHTRGLKILLGFTPYTYDGTNQYTLERPDLKGIQADGKLARMQGIHSWGYNLDPTKPDARRFMLEYAREMYFDFYPNADGLLIESSDIDICLGGACGSKTHYYELEYDFVKQLSDEVWAHKPKAEIIIHSNYFIGPPNGASRPYDPRWSVSFTPWTVNLDLVKRVSKAYYFDLDVISQSPSYQRASVRYVRDNGFHGYFPSQEFFTYVPRYAEMGEPGVIGRQLHPFGIDVIGLDENPYRDPLVSVNRIALREYAANPDLAESEFSHRLGKAMFGPTATAQNVSDLMFLHNCFYRGKSLFSASAQADPRVLQDNLQRGLTTRDELRKIQAGLNALPAVTSRLRQSANPAVRTLLRHANLITHNWDAASRRLLTAHLRE